MDQTSMTLQKKAGKEYENLSIQCQMPEMWGSHAHK